MTNHAVAVATEKAGSPIPSTPRCLPLSERLVDEGGTLVIDERHRLSDAERQDLVEYIAAVSEAMGDGRSKSSLISRLMRSLKIREGSEADAIGLAASFFDAVDDIPYWAVDRALADYNRGLLPNVSKVFQPTAAEFASHARSYVHKLRADQYRARRLLKARPVRMHVPDEERERVKARMAKLMADMRTDDDKGAGE